MPFCALRQSPLKTLLAGLRPETRTSFFAEFFRRFLPGEFDAFEEVGQEGGEELNELGGELRVHRRLLSLGRTVNE